MTSFAGSNTSTGSERCFHCGAYLVFGLYYPHCTVCGVTLVNPALVVTEPVAQDVIRWLWVKYRD